MELQPYQISRKQSISRQHPNWGKVQFRQRARYVNEFDPSGLLCCIPKFWNFPRVTFVDITFTHSVWSGFVFMLLWCCYISLSALLKIVRQKRMKTTTEGKNNWLVFCPDKDKADGQTNRQLKALVHLPRNNWWCQHFPMWNPWTDRKRTRNHSQSS